MTLAFNRTYKEGVLAFYRFFGARLLLFVERPADAGSLSGSKEVAWVL